MADDEIAGPKKPAKSTSAAPKKSARPAAKKPAKGTAAKGAGPAAKKRAKTPGAAARKPAKVVSAPVRKGAKGDGPARKPATRAAGTASPARRSRATPKVTPAQKPAETVIAGPKPAAAGSKQAPSRAPARRKVVEGTARTYFEALAARDADAAMRNWDANAVDDIVPLGIFRGSAAIRGLLEELFTAMPDARYTVERITADDSVAAVQWRIVGTFSDGPFQGLEPTGRRVDLRGVDCLEVVDGKIVRNTGMFDGAAFARQVGLLPPEDSGADRAIRAGFNTVTKLRRTVAKRTAR